MTRIRVFEAFAGYGGASFGLKKSGIAHVVVGCSESDKYASQIFALNHPGIPNFGDITKIDLGELPDFDLFTGGFPCQPFSTIGLRKGVLDARGTLFYDIIRICEYKKPKHILLENVRGLATRPHRATFEKMLSELGRIGYDVRWKVLNSANYGVAQNRERLWIYGYRGELPVAFNIEPLKSESKRFKDFLDPNPSAYLYLNEKQIEKYIEKFKVAFDVDEPCCFDVYNRRVKRDGVSTTIREPHHNALRVVEVPRDGKWVVRKLSKTEHFRLMGFQDGEFNFGDFSYHQICKRAGNGWDINLVSILINQIIRQIS